MKITSLFWDVYAIIYDTLLQSPLYRELVNQVIEHLSLESANTLLNAGCGTGNLELEILSRHYNLTTEAVDSSIQMLSIAKKKIPNKVLFRQVNLNQKLDYDNNSFDRIAMIHVLYALTNPEFTLRELYRILRPDGILVVANPRKDASITKLIKANLLRLGLLQKFIFLLKMSHVIILNLFITRSGNWTFDK
ncbi:MAG: class I SAM-dependent methyltransferase [candidate division Zixibacteria bacterium]|nr:class I SAM-dependent methyltransferase [candidate division Zixibacteria bacterium]